MLMLAGAVLMFAGASLWRVLVFCWCRCCAAATAELLRNAAAMLRDAAEMPPPVACKGVRHGRGGACERVRTWGQVAD